MAKWINALNCYINIDKYGSTSGAGRETGFGFYERIKLDIDMKRILTSLIIIAMATAAVSCNSKVDLNGEWKITSVGTEEVTSSEAAPSLSFNTETGRIHGYTGVNIVNGEYEQEGRKLSLKGLGMTMMAGPEDDMALERKILDAFEQVRTAKETSEGELALYDSEGEIIMTLKRR